MQTDPLTANSRHFLRVSAQMHNLDKQKTAQIRQTLPATMTNMKIKHFILTIGLLSVILSFLFFGRQQSTYSTILVSGLLISIAAYLTIVFTNGSKKSKIIWTSIVLVSALIQYLTEPVLINKSYKIYLSTQKDKLENLTSLLKSKSSDLSLYQDSGSWFLDGLDDSEQKQFYKHITDTDILYIRKTNKNIFFVLFSSIDINLGVYYFFDNKLADNHYTKIADNWYY